MLIVGSRIIGKAGTWIMQPLGLIFILMSAVRSSVSGSLEDDTLSCSQDDFTNAQNLTDTLMLLWEVKYGVKNTIRVCMESQSEGWLGFGISSDGMMIDTEAVIGLPDDGTVLKYNLNGKAPSAVVLMNSTDQTLMNANIEQKDGVTVLSFEKFLDEDQYPIELGKNSTVLFADASNNALGYHGSSRGNFTIFFDEPPKVIGKSGKSPKSSKSDVASAGGKSQKTAKTESVGGKSQKAISSASGGKSYKAESGTEGGKSEKAPSGTEGTTKKTEPVEPSQSGSAGKSVKHQPEQSTTSGKSLKSESGKAGKSSHSGKSGKSS